MHKSIQSSANTALENKTRGSLQDSETIQATHSDAHQENVLSNRPSMRFWSVRIAGVLGFLSLLTAPWTSVFHKVVIGAYPTIDKEGSLLFFEYGVHHLWFTEPSMSLMETGLPLIGIQVGHLWLTQVFAWVVPNFAAFNLQSFLHIVLNVLSVLFWLDSFDQTHQTQRFEVKKWIVGFIIGAQLHVFRDIHWYTIEKSALFPLFIFWGMLHRLDQMEQQTHMTPTLIIAYALAGLYNFYWAILLPILTLAYLTYSNLNRQPFRTAIKGCIVVGLLIGMGQWMLQTEQYQFAEADAFQVRASLDTFSLWPLDWNRMGFWRPINPLLLGIVVYAGWNRWRSQASQKALLDEHTESTAFNTERRLWFCMTLFCALSLGPTLPFNIPNPVYGVLQLLPGMWRFAKPEIFLLLPYAFVAKESMNSSTVLTKRVESILWVVAAFIYLNGLYTSSAFPYLTEYVQGSLNHPSIPN